MSVNSLWSRGSLIKNTKGMRMISAMIIMYAGKVYALSVKPPILVDPTKKRKAPRTEKKK